MERKSNFLKSLVISIILIILGFLFMESFFTSRVEMENRPKAINGKINLKEWDFEKDGIIDLDGQWEVYTGELLDPFEARDKDYKDKNYNSVPMNWKNYSKSAHPGYATFKLNVMGLDNRTDYAVLLNSVFSSYRVWANGELIDWSGKVSADKEKHRGKVISSILFVRPDRRRVELVIQVSSSDYYKGGLLESMRFGLEDQVARHYDNHMMRDSFLAGVILIMSIYNFMMYLFRRKDKEYLYFAIFAGLILFQTLLEGTRLFGYMYPKMSFQFEEVFQRIIQYFMVPCFVMYINYFFNRSVEKRLLEFYWGVAASFAMFTIVVPFEIIGNIMRVYEVLILASIVYFAVFIIERAKKPDHHAVVILVGFIFLMLSVVHDILVDNGFLANAYQLSFGLVVFLISQMMVLSMKHSDSFNNVESLAKELTLVNDDLKLLNAEIEEEVRQRSDQLGNSKRRYRKLFDSSFEGIALIDGETVVQVNKVFCEMFRSRKSEIKGRSILEFVDEGHHGSIVLKMNTDDEYNYEVRAIRCDGSGFDSEILSRKFVLNGRNIRVLAIRDLTDKKKQAKSVRENLNFLKKLVDTIPNPIFYKVSDSLYSGCNFAFAKIWGMTKDKLKFSLINDAAPKSLLDLYERMEENLEHNEKRQESEISIVDGSGKEHEMIMTMAGFYGEDGIRSGFVGSMVDISEYKKRQAQLREVSSTDHLTKLYNRLKFNEVLDEWFERRNLEGGEFSIIIFDIDHFKRINDTYGHFEGDEVLRSISRIVSEIAGDENTVARWGGEEFIILCPAYGQDESLGLAQKLRSAIEQKRFGEAGRVTCSFGVSAVRCGDDKKSLVKRADDALYEAKNAGRNKVVKL